MQYQFPSDTSSIQICIEYQRWIEASADSERRCNVRRAQTEVNASSYLMLFDAGWGSKVNASSYLMLFDAGWGSKVNASSYLMLFDAGRQSKVNASSYLILFDAGRRSKVNASSYLMLFQAPLANCNLRTNVG